MLSERIAKALNSRTPKTISGNGHKPAAVLIPIQERSDGEYLVLTRRADHLPTHKGQIAFPGGRVDPRDADATETALRECYEEIGIGPECVRVLGRLDEFPAGYGLVVTPIVGEALPIQGFVGFVDYQINPKWSTTGGYSSTRIDNSDGQAPDAYKSGDYFLVNVMHYPVAGVMMGGEYQWGRRTNFSDGFHSDGSKIQFSFKYNFSFKLGG